MLLILASISITVVLGDNGLIAMAEKAKKVHEDAQKDDQDKINQLVEQYGDFMNEIKENDPPVAPGEEILEVSLKLDEANVRKDKVSLNVAKVTNTKTGSEVTGKLEYTYSLVGETISAITSNNSNYEFTDLDETKSYTINVKVKDENNNYGEATIKVISFSIRDAGYYRCEEGITWYYFANSNGYDPESTMTHNDHISNPFSNLWCSGEGDAVVLRGENKPFDCWPDYDGKWRYEIYNLVLKLNNTNVKGKDPIQESEYDWYQD